MEVEDGREKDAQDLMARAQSTAPPSSCTCKTVPGWPSVPEAQMGRLPGALSTKLPSVCITAMVPSCPAVWVCPSGTCQDPDNQVAVALHLEDELAVRRRDLRATGDLLAWAQLARRGPG